MSSIDAVIARSRRPGAFAERQRFTLARSRAIQKMRQFALADPHYYILELVQSAVATGALYIDVRADDDTFTLTYLGGGLPEAGLANLFDFLFASKERGDLSGLRALALGVNALMLFEPARILIESGDGTAAGSARLEICGDQDRMDVGRPERPLSGTYIRAEGMKRGKVARALRLPILGGGADERSILEQRCLTAPVPIYFNQESIFGHSTVRIPPAFGYRRSIAIDEGDLFGRLGLDPMGGKPVFRLLTYGVLVEAIEHELLPGAELGGVINFDALHKTADHAKIVRDDRLDELWTRLRPYAMQLRRGGSAEAAYDVRFYGGGPIPAGQLRGLLRELGRVVVIDPETPQDHVPTAMRIAAALDAELLTAPAAQIAALRLLGGRDVMILAPQLTSAIDVAFYTRAPAEPPARPWQIAAIDVPTLAAADLVEAVEAIAGRALARGDDAALGERGEVRITLYTPTSHLGRGGAVEVHLWSLGREVSVHEVPAAHGGHVLVAELPELSPRRLRERLGDARPLADIVAEVITRQAAPALAEAAKRALLALVGQPIAPGTPQARLALSALVRAAIARLRRRRGALEVVLTPIRPHPGVDLLALPILATVSGRPLCGRDLGPLMTACHGVLYGVVPEVPADLDGLDRDRILDLDLESERRVLALVGEGAYVRVDARERLAARGPFAVRDLALGLRDFPDGPLLLEPSGPDLAPAPDLAARAPAERAALEEALFAQLLERYVDAPTDAHDPAAEEARRQALRHVQRYLCAAVARGDAQPLGLDLVIAEGVDHRGYSLRHLLAAMRERGRLLLHYDHGALPPPIDALERGEAPPEEVLVSPFLALLLDRLGPVEPAFDVALPGDQQGASQDIHDLSDFLVAESVAEGALDGVLGVLRNPSPPRVLLLDAGHRLVHVLIEPAREHGLSGYLRVNTGAWGEAQVDALLPLLEAAGDRLLRRLGAALPGLDPAARAHAAAILLDVAGRHLLLVADPAGRVTAEVTAPRAAAILDLPLFPGRAGLPVRGAWLIQRLCESLSLGQGFSARDLVAPAADPALLTWLDDHLHPGRVARQPSRAAAPASTAPPPPPPPLQDLSIDALAATLQRHLDALRPDPPVHGEARRPRTLVRADRDAAEDAPLCRVSLLGGTRLSIDLNPWHWLAERARAAAGPDPEALAWLLLAVYAEVNRLLDDVTNDHEEAMQRAVADALLAGELRPVLASS